MDTNAVNQKAWELRQGLFTILTKFRDFATGLPGGPTDDHYAAKSQAEDAASGLRRVYDSLGDLFIDAARDPKDQSYLS